MARPREFNTDEALDAAMQVFWSKGYEASSLSDLIGAMGISRSSLYETFGCKHELFLSAIDHYTRTVTPRVAAAADLDAPAPVVIASMFGRAVDRTTCEEGRRGCFLSNCAVEMAVRDEAARRRVGAGFGVMEETFHRLVERGQADGDIPAGRDARALARFLTSSLNGIMVMAKANPDRDALGDVARIALEAIA